MNRPAAIALALALTAAWVQLCRVLGRRFGAALREKAGSS